MALRFTAWKGEIPAMATAAGVMAMQRGQSVLFFAGGTRPGWSARQESGRTCGVRGAKEKKGALPEPMIDAVASKCMMQAIARVE